MSLSILFGLALLLITAEKLRKKVQKIFRWEAIRGRKTDGKSRHRLAAKARLLASFPTVPSAGVYPDHLRSS